MPRTLLSWYGITDLRASLGLDPTDGPVLAALKSGEYTDVHLLAYTDPKKKEIREEDYLAWEDWFTESSVQEARPLPKEIADLVGMLCNTSRAHRHFLDWLEGELAKARVNVRVHLSVHELSHLNDVDAIHSAASAAVRNSLVRDAGAQLTVYVSPGTPVMAFSWALIARSNPQLRIRVIASSDPSRGPEEVEIPRALLDPAIAPANAREDDASSYDLVIHLMGEQTLPILFGIRQFATDRTAFLTSSGYESSARQLKKMFAVGAKVVTIADPFVPSYTRKAITKQVSELPSGARVAINMTGGTKMMFAGALQACWELGLDPFYFEINDHKVVHIRDGSKEDFVGISSVKDLIFASGFGEFSEGRNAANETRAQGAEVLWKNRNGMRRLYGAENFKHFKKSWDEFRKSRTRTHPELKLNFGDNSSLEVKKDGSTKFVIHGRELRLPSDGAVEFVSGGWLEDYVFHLLQPLCDDGTIRDLHLGYEVAFPEGGDNDHDWPAQEFDCVFTDGKRLWIVECKSGTVLQEHIQKLQNNVRTYGGVAARGILVSASTLNKGNVARLDGIASIDAVGPDKLSTEELRKVIRRAGRR